MWSENYLSGACFPAAGAGVWLHQCRPQHDTRFWEEIFTFMLPGDRYLVAKGARLADGPAPAGPALTYECLQPFAKWRKSFHGLARLVSGEELRAGALTDGPHIAVDMELIWTGVGPAFDMDMSEQSWASVKAHYQQHCRITGTIDFGGEHLDLDGYGIRDHSWGPRDLSRLGNHVWIYGELESGRRIMYFHHVAEDGVGLLEHAHEADDDPRPLVAAGELAVPRPPQAWAEPYVIELRRADGEVLPLRGEILSAPALALTNGSEMQLGAPGPDATHHLFECATRFEWAGEGGYGITEWSWRT